MQLKIVESGYQVYNNETDEFCNVNFITQKAQGLCVCWQIGISYNCDEVVVQDDNKLLTFNFQLICKIYFERHLFLLRASTTSPI